MAHINKIKFYSHQLTMCAKVKAEVQNIAGELVVSGLDSATSLIQVCSYNHPQISGFADVHLAGLIFVNPRFQILIQAAKNLMNAVVQTVKASYVASTKFKSREANSSVVSFDYKFLKVEL